MIIYYLDNFEGEIITMNGVTLNAFIKVLDLPNYDNTFSFKQDSFGITRLCRNGDSSYLLIRNPDGSQYYGMPIQYEENTPPGLNI